MYDYLTFDEEFDMEEDDIEMILALHNNKQPKHGGSVFGRERLWRARVDGHIRLMLNYFAESPVYAILSSVFSDENCVV
jgi:hypothetical protein